MFKQTLKAYKKYKDSGVEWIGEIPAHWEVSPTKRIFRLMTDPAPENNNMELLSVYTDIGVKPRKELEERGNKASTTDYYWLVKKGDIIVNKLLAWMGAIGISEYDGVTSPAYDVLRKTKKLNPYYYHFLFRNPFTHQELKKYSKGIMDVRLRLYFSEFGRIMLPLPPIETQNRIVEYLNRKAEQADTFIGKQTLLVELLKEQKKAIINQAVTKGLNPDAPMKDSGIEWLGEIPAHWEVKKLKYLTSQITVGIVVTPAKYYVESGIPCLRSLNVREMKLNKNDLVYISQESNEFHKKSMIFHGDLVSVRTGQPGTTSVVDERFDGSNCIDLIITRKSSNFNSHYMAFYMNSKYAQFQYEKGADGAIQQHFNIGLAKNMIVVVPPIVEQKSICNFIDTEFFKVDQAIEKAEKEITLVKEYLQSLIYQVVTGRLKID
ncbi:restriction endonuclease subunit S [Desulfococcaceae bacterium HSG8]|nr:restriction endonuclease subunit S [Desulfococcaceae bacterium HSG8]